MEEDRYTRITLRIPKTLHAELQAAADASSKSMNAEIVSRLEVQPKESPLLQALARLNVDLALAELQVSKREREIALVNSKLRAAIRLLNRTQYSSDPLQEIELAEREESTDEVRSYGDQGAGVYAALVKYDNAMAELDKLRASSRQEK